MSKLFWAISKLRNWDKNPRSIKPEKFQELKERIKKYGQFKPIITTSDGEVIGGNMRLRAMKDLGIQEIWVSVVEPKTNAEKIEIALADNEEMGYYQEDQLAELISEYKNDIKLESFSIHLGDGVNLEDLLNKYQPEEIIEDEVPEVEDKEEPKSKLGEVYQLGRHRLMCGNSTDITQVEKLMNGEKADLAHNDPPYGMKKEKEGVLNDNLNFDDLLQFNKDWITLQFAYIKDNGSWYCWGIDEPLMDIYSEILKPYIKQQKATFRNLITWDKSYGQGQNSENTRSYAIADEKCLFAMMGVQGFNNNADNYYEGWEPIRKYLHDEMEKCGGKIKWKEALGNQMGSHYFTKSQWILPTEQNYKKLQQYAKGNAFYKEYEELKKEYDQLKKEYYLTRSYFNNVHDNFNNVWKFERHLRQGNEGGHATPKPIPLCQRVIKSSCLDKGLVIDFFGGSGSTLITCEQLNRTCYMMELDPRYVDVIRKRYAKFIGKENEWQEITAKIN